MAAGLRADIIACDGHFPNGEQGIDNPLVQGSDGWNDDKVGTGFKVERRRAMRVFHDMKTGVADMQCDGFGDKVLAHKVETQ